MAFTCLSVSSYKHIDFSQPINGYQSTSQIMTPLHLTNQELFVLMFGIVLNVEIDVCVGFLEISESCAMKNGVITF